ncbi:ankyrin, partial [Choiromyces venosus 120613-1]
RHRGTCEWISNEPQLNEWGMSGTSRLLWLYGAPGFGKTVMSKYIIERCEHQETSLVVYFHCDGKDESRKTELNILRSIIFQLLVRNSRFFEHVLKYMQMEKLGFLTNFSTTVSTLWKILGEICSTSAQGISIIIDAVDELNAADVPRLLQGLIDLVQSTDAQSALKVAVVSRPEWEIQRQLSLDWVQKIELSSARSQKDIESFLSETVGKFATENDFPDDQRDAVIEALKTRSDGMFLWATLAWTSFVGDDDDWSKASIKARISELEHLPHGLDALYRTMLKRIPKSKQPKARLLLTWLVYAFRPLKVQELNVVLALRPFHSSHLDLEENLGFNPEKRLRSLCGNLINIRNGGVSLLHQSTREYLVSSFGHPEDRFEDGGDFVLDVHAASLELSVSCLTYLNFDGFDIRSAPSLTAPYFVSSYVDADTIKFPFARYCVEYWPRHAVLVSETEAEVVLKLVQRLTDNEHKLAFAYQVNVNAKTQYGETALHYAMKIGKESEIEPFLAETRVDLNVRNRHGTALVHLAVSRGWDILSRLILNPSVDLNCEDSKGMSPLLIAAYWGKESITREIIKSRRSINIDATNKDGQTALHLAARHREAEIARLLIQYQAVLDVKDKDGRTALQRAAEFGSKPVLVMLVESGSDLTLVDKEKRTVLHWAATWSWEEVVEMLLQRMESGVKAKNGYGKTALHMAAQCGNRNIVRLLMASG